MLYANAGRYQLVKGWFDILDVCNGESVDRKALKGMIDRWAKEWARSSGDVQGYCSEEISAGKRPE